MLRGPRPDGGLNGIRDAIVKRRAQDDETAQARWSELQYWFADVSKALHPLEAVLDKREAGLGDIVAAHLGAAEALAGSELWKAEAGEAAANFIQGLIEAAGGMPAVEPGVYAALFRRLALTKAVRLARGGHPRVSILGPLEARLQSFDTIVLGGLNEGTWPRVASADPWFSRQMRDALGLERPERAIGQSAHDFAMLAAGPRVVLTRAQKAEGVPAIASRWVQRLHQLTSGLGLRTEQNDVLKSAEDYAALARSLNDPGETRPIARPRPTPPVAARPKRLPVTDIEKWVRDPYAIYARRVLRLNVLHPLDAPVGAMERGNAVHKALERFVEEFPGALPADAVVRLCAIADEVFAAEGTPRAVLALWRPRFTRAAKWFVDIERERRAAIRATRTEIHGAYEVVAGFQLYGVADRIDLLHGGGAAILDYKTGQVPTKKQIEAFLAPQLLLEAAMLAAGAFPGIESTEATELLYVQVSGGKKEGDVQPVKLDLLAETMARLKTRIAQFNDPAMPYYPRVSPLYAKLPGDYDHLARVREWSLGGWEAEE
jgi:ATP-dependent helicase/nuclease subunit B